MDKKKRILLILGVVALLAAVIYRFFPVVGAFRPSDDAMFLKENELHKLRAIVDGRSDLEARLVSLNKELSRREGGLLSGDTPALGAVDIQNILGKIAGDIGVEVKTMRILRTEKETVSHYLKIPVQIQIGCTIVQLKDLLYKIESSQKYLKVTSVRINVRSRGKGKGLIFSSLTVEGIMKKGIEKKRREKA